MIGQMKSDNLLRRPYLKGEQGDAKNAVLAAAGHNLRTDLAKAGNFVLFLTSVVEHSVRTRFRGPAASLPECRFFA